MAGPALVLPRFTIDEMVAVGRAGATLSFDLFGHEASHYAHADIDMPNDAGRIGLIRQLVDRGLGDRVVISQDICTKVHTKKWGGEGYTHILDRVIPQMKRRGFSEAEIAALTHDNPARLLAMPSATC